MLEQTQQSKRQRGVILSASGWQRLQAAKHQSEIQGNFAQPYTLEKLTELTGLSNNTVTKVQHRQVAVDQQTLAAYFRAFGLTLESTDYVKPNF
jgi:hypothetical protein